MSETFVPVYILWLSWLLIKTHNTDGKPYVYMYNYTYCVYARTVTFIYTYVCRIIVSLILCMMKVTKVKVNVLMM